MRKLRIAQIANLIEKIPPEKYGGIERVVSALTEELVRRGHEVTLFASGDSKTAAKLVSVCPKALRQVRKRDVYGLNELMLLNIGLAYSRWEEFDIIHDHNGQVSLPTSNISKASVIYTLHGPFTPTNKRLFSTLNRPNLVSISGDQAKAALPNVKIFQTIHHGLDMKNFPFSKDFGNYLLYVGRISPEKGVHFAIDVALELDLPLIIAGKLDTVDVAYFNEYIGPNLSDQVAWVGEVLEDKRNELMSKALCFLHPVVFREPFGLTLIEAMGCGTPAVAFGKGSIPEIIISGSTGFVVSDVEEMVQAVKEISKIDREFCRKYVLENFNVSRMVDEYEGVYQKILDNG